MLTFMTVASGDKNQYPGQKTYACFVAYACSLLLCMSAGLVSFASACDLRHLCVMLQVLHILYHLQRSFTSYHFEVNSSISDFGSGQSSAECTRQLPYLQHLLNIKIISVVTWHCLANTTTGL